MDRNGTQGISNKDQEETVQDVTIDDDSDVDFWLNSKCFLCVSHFHWGHCTIFNKTSRYICYSGRSFLSQLTSNLVLQSEYGWAIPNFNCIWHSYYFLEGDLVTDRAGFQIG